MTVYFFLYRHWVTGAIIIITFFFTTLSFQTIGVVEKYKTASLPFVIMSPNIASVASSRGFSIVSTNIYNMEIIIQT